MNTRIKSVAIGLLLGATGILNAALSAEPTNITVEKACVTASTTTTTVTGLVADANTAEPLVGVSIECNQQTYYSDLEGKYSMVLPANASLSVEVSLISYQPTTIELTTGADFIQNVSLKQR